MSMESGTSRFQNLRDPVQEDLRQIEEKAELIRSGEASDQDYREAARILEGINGMRGGEIIPRRTDGLWAEFYAQSALATAIDEQEEYDLPEEVREKASKVTGSNTSREYEGALTGALYDKLEYKPEEFMENLIGE